MNNIGYAVFKKTTDIIVECNGLFDTFSLETQINNISVNLPIGETLVVFKRIKNKQNQSLFLIVFQERIKVNSETFIIGSALCFSEFKVFESKTVRVLFILKNNIKEIVLEGLGQEQEGLGVVFPSLERSKLLFKDEVLKQSFLGKRTAYYYPLNIDEKHVQKALESFLNRDFLSAVECLLLVNSSSSLRDIFSNRKYMNLCLNDSGVLYEESNKETIKEVKSKPKEVEQNTRNVELLSLKKELSTLRTSNKELETKNKGIRNKRNLYRILFSLVIIALVLLGIFVFVKKKANDTSIYPADTFAYIDNYDFNVNIRNSPIYDPDNINLKGTLSDGDKVTLLGFDKETLWGKIRYNDDKDIGYVSSKLISKKINTKRISPVYKNAYIGSHFYKVPLYFSPKEIGSDNPKVLIYLDEYDKIFIKNKDLKFNTYSVKYIGDNKTYHGYIEYEYFIYQ